MSIEQEPSQDKGKGKAIDRNTPQDSEHDNNDHEFNKAVAESLKQTPGMAKPGESSASSAAPRSIPVPALPGKLELSKGHSFLFKKKPVNNLAAPTTLSQRVAALSKSKVPIVEEEEPIALPPWFAGGEKRDIKAELEKANDQTAREEKEFHQLRRSQHETIEISLDDDSDVEFVDVPVNKISDVGVGQENKQGRDIENNRDVEKGQKAEDSGEHDSEKNTKDNIGAGETEKSEVKELTTNDLAEKLRANPPNPTWLTTSPEHSQSDKDRKISLVNTDSGRAQTDTTPQKPDQAMEDSPSNDHHSPSIQAASEVHQPEEDDFDFSFELEDTPPPEELAPDELEEKELITQMEREAREHARFAAEISHEQNTVDYERELRALRTQQKKDRRDADEVSQVMIQEIQQLLTLFGLPYVTAPMEAEAQCAELVKLGLVDGIVTDDSDVFLFGGTRVYRHMFNDKQVVQCYLASDLEKDLALDQNRLIAAAQLLGSDYTEGISNVGPVTAIELLAEFPNDGLEGFKEWWLRVQQGTDTPEDLNSKFRKKFKKTNLAKVFLPATFPDSQVENAYLHPEVDSDPSPFEWGLPDLEGLRIFLMNSIGWSTEKTDHILVPVIQDMNKKLVEGAQSNITNYFDGGVGTGAYAPRVRAQGGSKRMEKAMERLKGQEESGGTGEVESAGNKGPVSMREKFADEDDIEDDHDEDQPPPKKKARKAATKPKAKRKAPAKRGKKSTS